MRNRPTFMQTIPSTLWPPGNLSKPRPCLGPEVLAGAVLAFCLLLAGCSAPIGAVRVNTSQAYDQVESNALRTGKPSAATVSILHRYGLDALAATQPDEAVRRLHEKALATGERDLLYALSELSYAAGEHIRHSVKPWDPRDARDYYLGSAVYAWLFLFGEGTSDPPSSFDRRFRDACDFYNFSLGLAFRERRSTNAVVQFEFIRRRLPVGEIEFQVSPSQAAVKLQELDKVLLADQFRVRGLSMRNREPGLGTPLICVMPANEELGLRPAVPATMLLRIPRRLSDFSNGPAACSLEFYSALNRTTVEIGNTQVPLELDLTTYRAYTLSQSRIWDLGRLQFLAPSERIKSRLIFNQPFDPNRIPVVFVHGTFSSPVTWAEMVNTLLADTELRRRYQFWTFMYGSGNPLVRSVNELRDTLTAEVARLDPQGTNAALRDMVVIGHSQGGLLTKATAVDTGDVMWRMVSTNRFEDAKLTEEQRKAVAQHLFLKPLPFVGRVVFIATPHRGSYLSGSFVRRLAQRLVSFPSAVKIRSQQLMDLMAGSEAAGFFNGRVPTSLDGMSPKNPALLAIAEIPVSPPIKANSIIAAEGNGDYRKSRDGLVTYQSAHVDYAESEFIVRSFHSCLDNPATIEEVRRILHVHLDAFQAKAGKPGR